MATTNSNISQAFDFLVPDATPCQRYFVVLWRRIPFYGGPQEGGWWGADTIPVKYTEAATEEAAEQLRANILAHAEELSREASRDHGRACLTQLAWCEERGIDDSNSVFGEDDGAEEHFVTVQTELPEAQYGERHYS
jgi:hypothetical protein